MDIASLGFNIDSSQATTATERLDRLHSTTRSLSQSTQSLALTSNDLRSALTQLANQVQLNNAAFQQTATSLEAMLTKLDQARAKIGETSSAFGDFVKVQAQVDALGRVFGTTSVAMEQYDQAARKLNMTSDQTVASMQRITAALENQTAMGRQIRQIMADYGVSLQGMGVNDAAKALEQFTTRMRQFQDNPDRFRSVQQVLGPITPDIYAKMEAPEYVPINVQEDRRRSQEYSLRAAQSAREAALLSQRNQRNNERYTDLSGRYDARIGMFGGISSENLGQIQRELGPSSDLAQFGSNSQRGRLAIMEWLEARRAKNPSDPIASGARTYSQIFSDTWKATGVPGWIDYGNTGGMTSDIALIRQLREEDRQKENGWGDWLWNNARMRTREIGAMFGAYTPPPGTPDTRPRTQAEILRGNIESAQTLMGAGDPMAAQVAVLGQRAYSLSNDASAMEARAAYMRMYGDREGAMRFGSAQFSTARALAAAQRPGGLQEDALRNEQWFFSQTSGSRGEAGALMRFLESVGVQQPGLQILEAQRGGLSMEDVLSGRPAGWATMTPQRREAFRRLQATSLVNTDLRETAQTRQFAANQNEIRGLLPEGQGSVAAKTAEIQALNAALADPGVLSFQEAMVRALEARKRAIDGITTSMAQEAEAQRESIGAQQRALDVMNGAGTDPTARGVASLDNQIAEAQRQAARKAGPAPYDDPGYRLRQEMGIKALAGAGDAVAGAQQELDVQRRLASVAGERVGVQERLNREIQVEREMQGRLNEAMASRNQDAIAQVQREIQAMKDLRNEIAEVNREAALFKLGQDAERSTEFREYVMRQPPSERGLARAMEPFWRSRYDSAQPSTLEGYSGADYSIFGPPLRDPTAPRGIRNNNPLNLSYRPDQGAAGSDGRFGVYDTMEQGIAASVRQLILNADRGLTTISQQIEKWAPASDNNDPKGYAARVASQVGVGVSDQIDFRDPAVMRKLVAAMAQVENGRPVSGDLVGRGVDLGLAEARARRDYLSEQRAGFQTQSEQAGIATRGQIGIAGNTLLGPGPAMEARIRMQVEQEQSQGRIPNGREGERASELRLAEMAQLLNQINSGRAAGGLGISSNQTIAQAYLTGGTAAGDLASRMDPNTLNMQGMIQHLQTLKVLTDGERQALQQLIPAMQQRVGMLQSEIDASRNATLARETAGLRDQNSDLRARTSLGIGWGPQFERAQLEAEIANQRARTPEGQLSSFNANATERLSQFDARQQAQEVQQLSQTFQQMGMAAGTAFTNAIISGQRFSTVIQTLVADLARMAAQRFILQPIMNFLGGPSMLGGLFGQGGGGGGLVSVSGMNQAPWQAPSAAGGVFADGHPIPFAGGGVVDRPTFFPMASGGTGLMGEGGKPEAVMPLMRLPNGNLGVQSMGGMGGSGHQIMVHAPITVHGGVQGDGKMDPSALKQMQEQMEGHLNAVFRSMLDNEMRPGGRLY